MASATGRSKSWVQRHVALFRSGGQDALVPKARGPKAAPHQTPPGVEEAVVRLRKELSEVGLLARSRSDRVRRPD